MTLSSGDVNAFLAAHPETVCAELTRVRGSSPREAGTFMLIAPDALCGTIGGGALEHLVVARARQALRERKPADPLDVPLGPEIGQCCGGRVEVSLKIVDTGVAAALGRQMRDAESGRPDVLVFGAGHVGQALAKSLALLPVRVTVIDTRPDELAQLPAGVVRQVSAMPEAAVRSAPEGSSYVILTHDHALDFLIAQEALKRDDAPYVGMVGSQTKRATFASWFKQQGGDPQLLNRLVLPIGDLGLRDKRPEVIAALAAAEILVHIGRREASSSAWPDTRAGAVHGR